MHSGCVSWWITIVIRTFKEELSCLCDGTCNRDGFPLPSPTKHPRGSPEMGARAYPTAAAVVAASRDRSVLRHRSLRAEDATRLRSTAETRLTRSCWTRELLWTLSDSSTQERTTGPTPNSLRLISCDWSCAISTGCSATTSGGRGGCCQPSSRMAPGGCSSW
jgi:hypothetical protein